MTISNFSEDAIDKFWKLHPQLIYMIPFNLLYAQDKSEDKKESSKLMWYINFMNNPDENNNIFYRIDLEERKKMLLRTIQLDEDLLEDDIVKECEKAYLYTCLTKIQRSLKVAMDSLEQRHILLRDTKPTLDYTDIIDGKPITIKGTATQLNVLQKDFPKLIEAYEKAYEKFSTEKATMVAKGGAYIPKGELDDED